MRRRKQSELLLLFSPFLGGIQFGLQRLHWWIGLLFFVYLGSGATTVQPDEVALVLRFGELRNRGTAQAVHQPGFLFALPKPFDEVRRLKVKKVYQQQIKGLHFTAMQGPGQPVTFLSSVSIDPEKVGYALTGDGNVIHLSFVANYQITDPIAYAFQVVDSTEMISYAVQSSAIRKVGSSAVDKILSDGRQDLIDSIEAHSQRRLDELNAGVTLLSLEVVDLAPPYQVKSEFNAVQSADIEAQTAIQEAEEYRVAQRPLAESESNRKLQQARSVALQQIAEAEAEANSFERLMVEYKKNPEVVHSRLYREGIENALKDVGGIQFVPAPQGSRYQEGFRITISAKEGK